MTDESELTTPDEALQYVVERSKDALDAQMRVLAAMLDCLCPEGEFRVHVADVVSDFMFNACTAILGRDMAEAEDQNVAVDTATTVPTVQFLTAVLGRLCQRLADGEDLAERLDGPAPTLRLAVTVTQRD